MAHNMGNLVSTAVFWDVTQCPTKKTAAKETLGTLIDSNFFFSFTVITKKRENIITLARLFFARNLIILLKPVLMEYIPVIKIFLIPFFLLISKRL